MLLMSKVTARARDSLHLIFDSSLLGFCETISLKFSAISREITARVLSNLMKKYGQNFLLFRGRPVDGESDLVTLFFFFDYVGKIHCLESNAFVVFERN